MRFLFVLLSILTMTLYVHCVCDNQCEVSVCDVRKKVFIWLLFCVNNAIFCA